MVWWCCNYSDGQAYCNSGLEIPAIEAVVLVTTLTGLTKGVALGSVFH